MFNFKKKDKAKVAAERPAKWEDVIGQEQVVCNLQVWIASARKRKQPLDHTLLAGPPGTGKTTFAALIAETFGSRTVWRTAPTLATVEKLESTLEDIGYGDVLFIDEIHRLKTKVQEALYTVLEDFRLGSKTFPKFTVVGATTHIGFLTKPMQQRFGIVEYLSLYRIVELREITERASQRMGYAISPNATLEIAKRSRGTPRIAIGFLKRARDIAIAKDEDSLQLHVVGDLFTRLRIDEHGLNETEREYIRILRRSTRPVSLSTMVSTLNVARETVEESVEPYMLRMGWIQKTKQGRIITKEAPHV